LRAERLARQPQFPGVRLLQAKGDDGASSSSTSGRTPRRPASIAVGRSARRAWHLDDPLSGDAFDRSGDGMRDAGLYVELGPWKFSLPGERRAWISRK
jgi:hypothetical protein